MIQKRLTKPRRNDQLNKAKMFAKLVLEGQINSTLRYLSEQDSGGILPPTDDVMIQLQDKHPSAQKAQLGSLVFGQIEDILHVIYHQINGKMIKEAALKTKGSGGPSGIDANGFRRMLASKSFKKSSASLCDAIAMLPKGLCTELVDPAAIEPILASQLIPLDKGNGESERW